MASQGWALIQLYNCMPLHFPAGLLALRSSKSSQNQPPTFLPPGLLLSSPPPLLCLTNLQELRPSAAGHAGHAVCHAAHAPPQVASERLGAGEALRRRVEPSHLEATAGLSRGDVCGEGPPDPEMTVICSDGRKSQVGPKKT